LTYPTARDLEGLSSPLTTLVLRRLPELEPLGRYRWLRALGVEALLVPARPRRPLPVLARDGRPGGGELTLYAAEDPAPSVWWPEGLDSAPDVAAALRAVAGSADAVAWPVLVGPAPPSHHVPGASVRLVEETPDRIELTVEGGGGVLAIRRAFLPLYRARLQNVGSGGSSSSGAAENGELRTLPINVCLLGVKVPAGRHRIAIEISEAPEAAAAGFSLVVLLAMIWGCLRVYRRGGVSR
ncbi:MAG: hypothetical protein MI919_14005, partial [Holophagales bacterium]|nr:hypothetical protein [Holophagales bacterium]